MVFVSAGTVTLGFYSSLGGVNASSSDFRAERCFARAA